MSLHVRTCPAHPFGSDHGATCTRTDVHTDHVFAGSDFGDAKHADQADAEVWE